MPTAARYSPSVAARKRRDHRHAREIAALKVSIGPMMAGPAWAAWPAACPCAPARCRCRDCWITRASASPVSVRGGKIPAVDVVDPLRQRIHRMSAIDHRGHAGRAQHRMEALSKLTTAAAPASRDPGCRPPSLPLIASLRGPGGAKNTGVVSLNSAGNSCSRIFSRPRHRVDRACAPAASCARRDWQATQLGSPR